MQPRIGEGHSSVRSAMHFCLVPKLWHCFLYNFWPGFRPEKYARERGGAETSILRGKLLCTFNRIVEQLSRKWRYKCIKNWQWLRSVQRNISAYSASKKIQSQEGSIVLPEQGSESCISGNTWTTLVEKQRARESLSCYHALSCHSL